MLTVYPIHRCAKWPKFLPSRIQKCRRWLPGFKKKNRVNCETVYLDVLKHRRSCSFCGSPPRFKSNEQILEDLMILMWVQGSCKLGKSTHQWLIRYSSLSDPQHIPRPNVTEVPRSTSASTVGSSGGPLQLPQQLKKDLILPKISKNGQNMNCL